MGYGGWKWVKVVKTPHYYTTLLEIVNMVGWLNNNAHTYQAIKFSTVENTHCYKKRLDSMW